MKTKHYKTHHCENYYLASTPITTINIGEFEKAFHNLSDSEIDQYTKDGMRFFAEEGYTEVRVSNAPIIKEDNQMVLFSYDEDFKSPIGLAICFDKKFYALQYSKGKHSESELYNIFINKDILYG